MEALVAQVNESCSVSVLDGDEVIYVARVSTHRIMTVAISVGTRLPAYATSMGRVLLAAQPKERFRSGRRRGHLRRPRVDPPDHDCGHQRRNTLARIRHLHGTSAARRPAEGVAR